MENMLICFRWGWDEKINTTCLNIKNEVGSRWRFASLPMDWKQELEQKQQLAWPMATLTWGAWQPKIKCCCSYISFWVRIKQTWWKVSISELAGGIFELRWSQGSFFPLLRVFLLRKTAPLRESGIWSSQLTFGKKANKCISQNVKLLFKDRKRFWFGL